MGLEAHQTAATEQRPEGVLPHLIGAEESVPSAVAVESSPVPDLAVDDEMACLIHRRRYRAVVRAKTEVPVVHKGLRRLMREQLAGREPATMFFGSHIEVNFGVMDDRPASWDEARLVGRYLMAVLDPIQHREPQLGIAFVDTSDLDPYLPEDRRTLL